VNHTRSIRIGISLSVFATILLKAVFQ